MKVKLLLAAVCLGLALLPASTRAEEEKPKVIEDGSKVSIEYTLKLDDGSTADTNVGDEPLVYEQGRGQLLPALEDSLSGLRVNDQKSVTLTPEQGYGAVDPEAVQTVPIDVIPEDAREVGAQLVSESRDGRRRVVRITEVRESDVVVDLNHPLAGQILHFDIRVLSIE